MSPRQVIVKLLDRLDQTNAYADLLFENEIRKASWSDSDKALIQEIFFGVIRWRGRLDWIAKQFYRGDFKKAPRFVQYILQSAIYQLSFMNRVPAYAVIHAAVDLAKTKGGNYWANKTNAILRAFQRGQQQTEYPDIKSEPIQAIAVRFSHPAWMVKRWIQRWGVDETMALCETNNTNPLLSLRVNRLKTKNAVIENLLAQNSISARQSRYSENFLTADRLPDLSNFEPFQQGLFSVQDVSAGLACELLAPQPGDRIIDLCAAPGGKATFLAELSQDKAKIIAVDVNLSRLNLVRQNVKRLALTSVQLIQADSTQFNGRTVDKIILDAPCSGLGVLAKRVDLRWKRTPDQIKELAQLQLKILQNAAKLMKPGGVIVYCTCTIEPEENEQIIENFLIDAKDFQVDPASKFVAAEVTTSEGYIRTLPHRHGIDGSFAVRLVKS